MVRRDADWSDPIDILGGVNIIESDVCPKLRNGMSALLMELKQSDGTTIPEPKLLPFAAYHPIKPTKPAASPVHQTATTPTSDPNEQSKSNNKPPPHQSKTREAMGPNDLPPLPSTSHMPTARARVSLCNDHVSLIDGDPEDDDVLMGVAKEQTFHKGNVAFKEQLHAEMVRRSEGTNPTGTWPDFCSRKRFLQKIETGEGAGKWALLTDKRAGELVGKQARRIDPEKPYVKVQSR